MSQNICILFSAFLYWGFHCGKQHENISWVEIWENILSCRGTIHFSKKISSSCLFHSYQTPVNCNKLSSVIVLAVISNTCLFKTYTDLIYVFPCWFSQKVGKNASNIILSVMELDLRNCYQYHKADNRNKKLITK